MYVVQLERQSGELSLVAGYAGEIVTEQRSMFDFAPDRGLTRAFLGRAATRSARRATCRSKPPFGRISTACGSKGQYSEAVGAHWRGTLAGTVIGGDEHDFIGQYHRNSHLLATLRYSF